MHQNEKLKMMQAIQCIAAIGADAIAKENKSKPAVARLKKRVSQLETANREVLALLRKMRDNHRCEGGCGWCSQYVEQINELLAEPDAS